MSKLSLMNEKQKYHEAWKISKKYTIILMDHEKDNKFFDIASSIYSQYLAELKDKKLSLKKNYIQVWETMINTVNHNIKEDVCRAAIKLLHQTSIQRSYLNN